VLAKFLKPLYQADYLVGHNVDYDIKVMSMEYGRLRMISPILRKPRICTMKSSTNYVKIPGPGLKTEYKYPKLSELYWFLFHKPLKGAHNALADVRATAECFHELRRRGVIKV
jgi:DNA polymerase III epsilon subunit-like protein